MRFQLPNLWTLHVAKFCRMERLIIDSTEAFFTFKLNGCDVQRCRLFLQVSALGIFFAVESH
ncbi:MAG: hypothetical protein NWE84_04690 [Candidatus Bathyarchaeota archaeon]|nr:hypothetical protein [Candidatus Bathyarchaeota archaeon]